MREVLVALISGAGGTIIGCIITWRLMTRATRNQARRDALVMAAEVLQNYKVYYAQFYSEYLSPLTPDSGNWVKPPTGKPDSVYIRMMADVDKGRARLLVIQGLLYALFPKEEIEPICTKIRNILHISSFAIKERPSDVDNSVNAICDQILDLVRKYF